MARTVLFTGQGWGFVQQLGYTTGANNGLAGASGINAVLIPTDMPLFPSLPSEAFGLKPASRDAHETLSQVSAPAAPGYFGEQTPDNAAQLPGDSFEWAMPEGGLSGLVDGGALFDFGGYLERVDQRIDALGRLDDLDLASDGGASAMDSNGISVPLSWLLEHISDSRGPNDASLLQAQAEMSGTDAGGLAASVGGWTDFFDNDAPLDFTGYLEMSEHSIAALGRVESLTLQAADSTIAIPVDEYSVQLSLLLDQVSHNAELIDAGSMAHHIGGELPSAAELTGMHWLSPDVVDTFGFDYSLF